MEKKWLNHIVTFFAFFGFVFLAISSATAPQQPSVRSQGIYYFVGKTESDLILHFGYNGDIVNFTEEYDKAIYFTDEIIRYTAAKQNVTRYKKSESTLAFRIFFAEFNDGCLHWLGGSSSKLHYMFDRSYLDANNRRIEVYRHSQNDNSFVRAEVSKYNSEARRLNAVDFRDQQDIFQRTNIGSWYFVYKEENIYQSGRGENGRPESYVWHDYSIFRIDVKADDRIETERHNIASYSRRRDQNYDGNGNAITKERVNAIFNQYRNNGFTINESKEGNSMVAYIKDDIIIKVENK